MKISTKNLVIFGFTLILIIIGGMALSSYITNNKSAEGFDRYQGYLNQSILFNSVVDNFANATTQMVLFKQNPGTFKDSPSTTGGVAEQQDFFANVQKYLATSEKDAATLTGLLGEDSAKIRPELEKTQGDIKKYRELSTAIHGDLKTLRLTLSDVIEPATEEIEENYKKLDQLAISIENTRLSSRGGQIFANFIMLRNKLNRSIDRIDPALNDEILGELDTIMTQFVDLRRNILTEAGREYIDSLIQKLNNFRDTTKNALEYVKVLDTNYASSVTLNKTINAELLDLLAKVTAEMDKIAADVEEINADGTKMTVIFGIAGIIIGAIIAIFIIIRLVSTLSHMAGYAKEIAVGNFSASLDINEPGEMGEVASSLRSIPEVLNEIVVEFRQLAKAVTHGQLDIHGDPEHYKGSFKGIIEGTNDIMNRFRSIIDEIPSIVVTLDNKLRVAYMNPAGQAVGGTDYKGKPCKVVFAREDDATSNCALTKAATELKRHSAETIAHPQGKEMDITYTAIPVIDESGSLTSVIQFITDLTHIKSTQRAIVQTVHQATEIADRVAAASEELAAQMHHVNQGAEMQSDRVSSTATAMEEMNATVLDVARNAGQASEQTDAARDKAHDGAAIVSAVVDSINRLNEITNGLHTDMSELGKKAEEVGSVMGVIADIADQTNLLALNAAIEAARAGEAGRGFAVVADEVRKLAENTMSATSEVGAVIQAIQQATTKNINNVNNAAENMATATDQAHNAGAALNEIVDLVNESALLISGIATASEQQSATSEEINRSVDEINRIVSETSESVVQSSAAVDDLARIAIELKQVLDNLRD